MAFRLKHKKSISKELARILQAEFRTALDSVDVENPTEEAIHTARKSLKKIRAILRLLKHSLGRDYARENRRLRTAAHRLAPLRDADAKIETLSLIHRRYPTIITKTVSHHIVRELESQRLEAESRTERLLARVPGQLRRARSSAPRRVKKAGSFSAVRRDFARAYARAQEGLATVSMDSDAAQFHAWRRRIKDHTYHVRLFERLHSTPLSRARSLKELEALLGDDHNLAVLRSTILARPGKFSDARTSALVLGCIVKAQTSLRQDALKLARRLFAREPDQFRTAVATWWRR